MSRNDAGPTNKIICVNRALILLVSVVGIIFWRDSGLWQEGKFTLLLVAWMLATTSAEAWVNLVRNYSTTKVTIVLAATSILLAAVAIVFAMSDVQRTATFALVMSLLCFLALVFIGKRKPDKT